MITPPEAWFQTMMWLIPLIVWSVIWKGMALWKSARNNQLPWFVAMLILNTAGVLEIIYLIWFQQKTKRK